MAGGCIHSGMHENLFLLFLAEAVQHGIVSQIDHALKLMIREIGQKNRIPIGLLHWRAMVSPNDLAWIYLTIEISQIGRAFQGDLIVLCKGIKLGKNFSVQLIAYGNRTEGECFFCLALA